MLNEQDRAKLDGIVQQMVSNGEPEANIQFVVNDFKTKYAGAEAPVPLAPKQTWAGTLLNPLKEGLSGLKTLYGGGEQGIATKLATNVKEASADIQRGDVVKGITKAGFRTAGDVAGTIYAPIGAAIGATGLSKAFDYIGKLSLKGGSYNPLNKLTDMKAVQDFVGSHPNLEEDFGRALNLAFASAEKGVIDPKTVVPRTIEQMKSGMATATTVAGETAANLEAAAVGIRDAKNRIIDFTSRNAVVAKDKLIGMKPGELKANVILNASQKNVTPLMDNSVKALTETPKSQISGATKSVKDPLTLYNEFAKMEENFKINTHADTAAGLVGERTGKAFDTVVKTRQKYGKVMGEELTKVGSIKVEASNALNKHVANLEGSGVKFNGETYAPVGAQSKFTSSELSQLNDYTNSLKSLGPKPSVSDIDAFLSRTSTEMNLYKAKNNILSTTNAERIIKNSLNDLRTAISESKNPSLATYIKARSNYAKLSDFLDEGISFLGKKTSSGDYAKDASLVKSSVQSILNGGKKDWLIKLEKLTGYNALDEGVIAFQAMKDAGNFRGQSLLDLLTPKDMPTSKAGFTAKVVDYAMQKGTDAITGSPAEQTRRVIQNILSQKEKAAYNTMAPNASAGDIANKMQSSSNSTIKNSIPQLSPEAKRVLQMKGIDTTTPIETAITQIKQSGAFPIEKSIANGDIPRNSVFKGKGDTLTVPFAQGRIDDVAQKLDMHKPGLGDMYRASVNANNTTMAEIIKKGLDFLK